MAQPVQHTLQDIAGGDVINNLGATFSGRIRLKQGFFGGHRAQPFIPEPDGQIAQPIEIAGKGAGRLAARAFGAVHVARQPKDHPADARDPR